MSTPLEKPVYREIQRKSSAFARHLIVGLLPGGVIQIREKGRQVKYTYSVERLFEELVLKEAGGIPELPKRRKKV